MLRVAQKIGHHHRIIDACLLISNMSFSRFSSTFPISILRIHLLEVLHCTKKTHIFDREKRSYRGPRSGSYASCDFVYLIDYNDFVIL